MDGYNPKWRGKARESGELRECHRNERQREGIWGGGGRGIGPKPDRPTSMLPRAGFRSRGPCLAEVACSGPAHAPASNYGTPAISLPRYLCRYLRIPSGPLKRQICSAAISVKAAITPSDYPSG